MTKMQLIFINRKVFNALADEAREVYVRDQVTREVDEYNEEVQGTNIGYVERGDVDNIVRGIISLIVKNENIIRKYSWKGYLEELYPASEQTSGFSYTTGKYAVSAFDWSAENEDELEYSFNVLRVL